MHPTPLIPLGEQSLLMWSTHKVMSEASANTALAELAEIAEAYSLALEVIASSASRAVDKFAKMSEDTRRADAILTGFIVGLTLVEHSILGGFGAQAAALVRQEFEAVAALEELRIGSRREGRTPNIRHVPSVPGTVYSDLSKATHFSDTAALRLLGGYRGSIPDPPGETEVWLLSPQHVPNTTKQLFALHTLLLLHFAEHQINHYTVLHGFKVNVPETDAFERSLKLLKIAGVIESDTESDGRAAI